MHSRRWLACIGIVLLALAGMVAGIATVGWLTPLQHRAAGRVTVAAPPERVWEILTDVTAAPRWRSGLQRVEVLSAPGEALVFREYGDAGEMSLEVIAATPPAQLVTRILDEDLGFGGTWTFELRAAPGGTVVEIREDGTIDSLLFRGMTRLFFSHTATIEAYLRDLAAHLGDDGAVVTETHG